MSTIGMSSSTPSPDYDTNNMINDHLSPTPSPPTSTSSSFLNAEARQKRHSSSSTTSGQHPSGTATTRITITGHGPPTIDVNECPISSLASCIVNKRSGIVYPSHSIKNMASSTSPLSSEHDFLDDDSDGNSLEGVLSHGQCPDVIHEATSRTRLGIVSVNGSTPDQLISSSGHHHKQDNNNYRRSPSITSSNSSLSPSGTSTPGSMWTSSSTARSKGLSNSKASLNSGSSPEAPIPSRTSTPNKIMFDHWAEYIEGSSGRKFYYNTVTRESSWKPPRRSGGHGHVHGQSLVFVSVNQKSHSFGNSHLLEMKIFYLLSLKCQFFCRSSLRIPLTWLISQRKDVNRTWMIHWQWHQ